MSEPAPFQPMPDGKGHLALDGVSRAELFEHSAYLADAANRLGAELRELRTSIRPSTLRLEIRELEAQRDNVIDSISGPYEFDDQPPGRQQSYEADIAITELDLRIDTLRRAVNAPASRDEPTEAVPTGPARKTKTQPERRNEFDTREVRTFGIYARALFNARDGSGAQHRQDAARIAEEICTRYGDAGIDLYNSINQSRITDILDTDYEDLRTAIELTSRYEAMNGHVSQRASLKVVNTDFPQSVDAALKTGQGTSDRIAASQRSSSVARSPEL